MIYDTHLHTEISRDSQVRLPDYLKRARELGMGIIPTEHIDYDHPYDPGFVFEPENYFEKYTAYRGKGVYLGVEIGMQKHTAERSRMLAEQYPFDHILCSLHILDGIDLTEARAYDRPKNQVFRDYLQRIAENLPLHNYMTSLGHIDYISRAFCARYPDRELHYAEYAEEIDAILKWLSENEKSIELNTRRFPDAQAEKSLRAILSRFAALGGKHCTLGSDCHNVGALGGHLTKAATLARECGLLPVYYVGRKPVLC